MRYTRKHILYLSLGLEGALAFVFFIWAHFRGYHFPMLPTAAETAIGAFYALPLFALNYVIFGPASARVPMLHSCYEFKDRVVRPLADALDISGSAVVAVCAGVGEELFFRGLVQTELGIVAASVLFSVLHFGPAAFKYLLISVIYTAIGFYFGFLLVFYHSLWVPIVAHVTYDFIALIYIRYFDRSAPTPQPG